jgi:hypothetical protein
MYLSTRYTEHDSDLTLIGGVFLSFNWHESRLSLLGAQPVTVRLILSDERVDGFRRAYYSVIRIKIPVVH